ncbi:MAG: pilus assembly FimT family protein [Nitrospiraceae bacterium]
MQVHETPCSKSLFRTREAGFTLIEVLIVVGIMGIAAAMAAPNYIQWNARSQLRQAVTGLQGSFSLARMAAMNQNTTVIVTPAVAGGQLTATFTNPAGGTVMSPFTESVRDVTTVAGGPVQFSSLGLRVGGGAVIQTVTVTNRYGLVYSISVTAGGKVRWCATAICTS